MKLTHKQRHIAGSIWVSRHGLNIKLKQFVEISILNLHRSEAQLKRTEIDSYLETLSYLITLGVHES